MIINLELLWSTIQTLSMWSPVGFISYFLYERHLKKKELTSKDLENETSQSDIVARNLDLYQRMLDDISEKLMKAHSKIEELELEIEKLKSQYLKFKELYENSINK